MTITIRNLVEAHLESAKVILDAAYGGSRSRISSLRRYLALQPDGVFLALLDDLPAGIGGVIDYGAFATVGMVGVLPEMQRRGIGRAIMQHILGWIGEQGCREVTLDATNAGAALYTSLGFDTTGYTCQFQQAERTTVPSVESRIVPASMTDVAAIAAMDRPVFGAQREHVLAALIAGYPARAFISYNKAGDVTGYVIAQEQTLGPWVAHTSEDAEALLLAALA